MTTDPTPLNRAGFPADRAKAVIEDALAAGVPKADLITFTLLRAHDPDTVVYPVRTMAAARRAALRSDALFYEDLATSGWLREYDGEDERRAGIFTAIAIALAFLAVLVCVVLAGVLIFGG